MEIKDNSDWEFKLFDCAKNPLMCAWVLCVPCGGDCMQAVTAKVSDPRNRNAACVACLCSFTLFCYGGVFNRHRLSKKLGLKDNIFFNILTAACCESCGNTQEWMETMKRVKGNHELTIVDYIQGKI
ncbi:unnamed protein product [Blepharisma stoltei]|uniref:Uncharacterized protein n=1 Tax=Blepharisma stoltei TaxID=1481888 RepID=A0AAU9K3F5_9CILI|nr:unnamed protein product [Blepharisma stoltei]